MKTRTFLQHKNNLMILDEPETERDRRTKEMLLEKGEPWPWPSLAFKGVLRDVLYVDYYIYDKSDPVDLIPKDAVKPAERGKCDFCSQECLASESWFYPAMQFKMYSEVFADGSAETNFSGSAWCACEPCHNLIERGDLEAIARRNVGDDNTPLAFWCRSMCMTLWQSFEARRTGPAYRGRN